MSRSLSLVVLLVAATSVADGRDGVVGISVGDDFTVITAVALDSPAGRAGVRAGDRIVAVDGHPTSELERADFERRVSGPPGSEIELQLRRSGTDSIARIRLRRIPAPIPPPSQIPPGFNARQVRGDANEPNQAMQRTTSSPRRVRPPADKAATDVSSVCHPLFGCVARFTGLAVADLVSR